MTDINIGVLTEALNDKTDRDMRNVDNTAGADAVIEYQMPTADNNYTWYRKYKSGWAEMGGAATIPARTGNGSSTVDVNLPLTMKYASYQTNISIHNGSTYWATSGIEISARTTTTVTLRYYQNNSSGNEVPALPVFWEVKGYWA